MQRDQTDQDEQKENFQRTNQKPQGLGDHLIQSKYQGNQQPAQNNDYSATLDSIEAQIKQIAKRLQEIKLEQLKDPNMDPQNYRRLQQERRDLKKRVIDLDFDHKTIYQNSVKESKRKQAEDRQKSRKQAEQERQRRLKELDQRYKKDRQEREQLSSANKNKEKGEEQQHGQQKQQGKNKQQQKEEQNLAQSRRKVRIAEIQAELIQSRLRRSRVAALNAELDYLRISYTYPYLSWRDYYPYGLYPYTSYPRPLYPYSSYIYPSYRYRWWL